jgi:hypothetical protein
LVLSTYKTCRKVLVLENPHHTTLADPHGSDIDELGTMGRAALKVE